MELALRYWYPSRLRSFHGRVFTFPEVKLILKAEAILIRQLCDLYICAAAPRRPLQLRWVFVSVICGAILCRAKVWIFNERISRYFRIFRASLESTDAKSWISGRLRCLRGRVLLIRLRKWSLFVSCTILCWKMWFFEIVHGKSTIYMKWNHPNEKGGL